MKRLKIHKLGIWFGLAVAAVTIFGGLINIAPHAFADDPGTAAWVDATTIKYNNVNYTQKSLNGTTMTLERPRQTGALDCGAAIVVTNYQNATEAQYISRLASTRGGGCQDQSPVTIKLAKSYESCINQNDCGATTAPTDDDACPIDKEDHLRWVLCPLFTTGLTATTEINKLVANFLYVKTDIIFGTPSTSNGGTANLQNAYNTFRNIGLGLLVIAGLVMVFSQSIGLEIFSAHTVRKALPRIVFAAIGMSLAWPILQFVIIFFNDLGTWISQIILSAAHVTTGSNPYGDIGNVLVDVSGIALAFLVGKVFFTGGWLLSLIGTILLGALVALIVLAIRQLVILLSILLAPLAIAASVLPGTDRLWKFWRDTLLGALLMFPIMMGFLASGLAMSSIAAAAGSAASAAGDTGAQISWDLLAVIVCFAPYFFIPFAFRLASGLMGNIFGLVNDRGKGAFDWLKKKRQEEREFLHQQRMEDRANDWVSKTPLAGLYRRANTRGGFSLSASGRRRYNQFDQKRRALAGRNIWDKEDANIMRNDDTANELAIRAGMTEDQFVEEYARANIGGARGREIARRVARGTTQADAEAQVRAMGDNAFMADARADARNALARLESSYNARLGSGAMRLAAGNAVVNSGTSYRGSTAGGTDDIVEGDRRFFNDIGALVRDGLLTADQAAGNIKFSPGAAARKERAGGSFGMTAAAMTQASQGSGLTTDQVLAIQKNALYGNDPSDLLRGRPEVLQAAAPIMVENVTKAIRDRQAAFNAWNANRTDRTLRQQFLEKQRDADAYLAQIDSLYTYMKGVSQEKTDILARDVLGRVIGPDGSTPGQALAPNGQPYAGPGRLGVGLPKGTQTLRMWIETARARDPDEYGQQTFLDISKEYSGQIRNAAAAQQAAQAAAQQGAIQPPGNIGPWAPPGTP